MHDEGAAARLAYGADKIAHHVITLDLVDTDAVLDRDRDADGIHHRLDAICHQRGLGHQAGPKRATLHPLARAATVQVDLIVAPRFTQLGALRQILRLTAAQLQRQGMLFGVELKMPRHIAVDQRAGRHHLGIQQRAGSEQTVKVAAMAIRPVHHGGDRQPPWIESRIKELICKTIHVSRPLASITHACQGLMTAAPAASKGFVSRVATANPLVAAMAAM